MLLAAAAAFLGAVAYLNALHGPFTYDDYHEIVENQTIERLDDPLLILRGHLTRPVVNFSYALDYARGGRDVFPFHVTNVALHLVNVLLLFAVVRRLSEDLGRENHVDGPAADTAAFLAAALFAVHPMMTEAVSYVSSRSELVSGVFFLSAFYAFRRSFSGSGRWAWAGFLSFVLALGSKETAAMLPFVLLASDWLVPSASNWRVRFWRLHVWLVSLVLIGGSVRAWHYVTAEQQNGVGALMTWSHVGLQLHVVTRYLGLLVLPISQTIVPAVSPITSPIDARLVTAVVALAACGALAVRVRNSQPLVTLGAVWFGLVLLPSSLLSLPEKIAQPMAEHRIYLASCGLFMAAAAAATSLEPALDRLRRPLLWKIGAAGIVLVVLSTLLFLTSARNRLWADPIALWDDAARKAPDIFIAHANLGYERWAAGDCDGAETAYRRAMDLRPAESDPYVIVADCLVRRGRLGEADGLLRRGIQQAPTATRLRMALASLQEVQLRRPAEALRLCREALALDPGLAAAQECIRRNERR